MYRNSSGQEYLAHYSFGSLQGIGSFVRSKVVVYLGVSQSLDTKSWPVK